MDVADLGRVVRRHAARRLGGSTSGSIKLIRHVVIGKMLRREIDQTLHPGVVVPLRVNGAVVDERALRAIIVFVFLYLGVWAAGVDRHPARPRRCRTWT